MVRRPLFLFIGLFAVCLLVVGGCSGTPANSNPGALTVTTTALASGSTSAAYSATVDATGGVAPFTWSIASGSLPAGLSLGTSTTNSVLISGTPTAQGTFSFTIKVTDSKSASASASLSIKVSNLAITTASPLPAATGGTAYSVQLAATGGTAPYQWSLATGSTLPAGLTLSSTGLLSGTPTLGGTDTFGVTVTDSESPAAALTKTFSLTISGTGGLTLLSGSYAFRFSGFNATGSVVAAGSFLADGTGKITGGVEDVNTTTTHDVNQTFTGTYTLGADYRGTLIFSSIVGSPTYGFAIDATGAHGRLIEFDSSGVRGSGEIEKQSLTTCAYNTIAGEYAVGITGNSAALGGFSAGPVALAGRFTASPPANSSGFGSVGNGEMDANTPGFVPFVQQSVSGTYQATSQTGRCAATIAPASLPSMTFSAYPVSASEFFLVETDTVSANTPFLTVGRLMQQVGYPFSRPTGGFTATSVGGLTGQFLSGSAYVPDMAVASITVNGLNAFTLMLTENQAGTVRNFSGTANFVNADTFGRVATNLQTPVAPVFYMINTNQAFAVGEINNNPFFGLFEPQSTGPFSAASIEGTYFEGTSIPATSAVRDTSGVLVLDGMQTISGTQDQSTASANTAAQAVSGTYAIANTASGIGGLTLTTPSASTGTLFIVSANEFVIVTTTAGDADPVLIFAGN